LPREESWSKSPRGVAASTGSFTFTFTSDSKHLLYQAALPASQLNELRIVPVEGGQSKALPIKGQFPSMHPDGRLTFTQMSGGPETWMVRNLPLK
jgi:hypothetical protein